MVTEHLQKKIDNSIRLLQSVAKGYDGEIEVAYSGGKDSDVILQLAKESGIRFRAIYKNTTIDPSGTIAHAKAMGAEVRRPIKNFFQLVADNGYPNRFYRFCCEKLKEYKVLDKCIIGVRKSESRNRNERYKEPTACLGTKENPREGIYPILEWTDEDVRDFILDRGVKCAPAYYDENGKFYVERRLGCMGCPLKSKTKRIEDFKQHPNLVKAYVRAGKKYFDLHPDVKTAQQYEDIYEWFVREVFYESQKKWEESKGGLFGRPNYKKLLEDYFGLEL